MSNPFWALAREDVLQELGVDGRGLSNEEAEARLRARPRDRSRPPHPFLVALASQAKSPLAWLLLGAALVGFGVGERTDTAIVLAILALGVAISVAQEGRAGQALALLRARIAQRATVLRDGQERSIPAREVVPGDVIILVAGTMVPADGLVIEARDLFISEAALTGEPFGAEKRPGTVPEATPLGARTNVVYMGTNVRSGAGRAVIVRTGAATEFGKLSRRLALRPPETEFQRGLRHFGMFLLSMMIVLVFVVFAASAVRHHPPIEALLFAVALAIGLAPEMLPAVLATMLSRGARRMAARGVLVRRLEAIENLGNMDVLCTDKTGTLTEGTIRLGGALAPDGSPSQRVRELAYWNAALQAGLPNPLDRAIVEAFGDQPPPAHKKVDEIPFDFTRKRLSVLIDEGVPLLITKGAFEAVLAVSTLVREGTSTRALDSETRDALRARASEMGERGVRVIAVATRALEGVREVDRASERELVMEGLLTFEDPPQDDVVAAIRGLQGLGVRVKIVSGDHHTVVQHLASIVGIASDRVVCGSDLSGLRDEALWNLASTVDLFAEVDPGQKERILLALKKTGHVVGFMGDGINDAPALHAADVGISVEGAADVAREAADFILLERGLDTVLGGIEEGRVTFANTLKYVLTTESANLGNMLSMAGAALFLPFLPMLAHQVLLNNLLSDVPSATLSGDRVDPELTARPQRWDIRFISRFMISFGVVSAVFDAITFVVLTALLKVGPEAFRTAWFLESLATELLVLLVLRTRRRFWRSRPKVALVVSTVAVALIATLTTLPPLREPLGFVALAPATWLAIGGVSLGYVLVVEIVKKPLIGWIERSAARAALGPRHHLFLG